MKNSLKYIATIAFLLLPHSYAQQRQPPAIQLPSASPSVQQPSVSQPQQDRIPEETAPKTTTEKKDPPCIIPSGREIIHIPAVKHWNSYSEVLQTMQETREVIEQEVDDAVLFLESTWEKLREKLTSGEEDADEKSQEAGESDSEQQYILDEEAYPHYVLARLIQDIPHSFIFHEFLTQVYDIRDVSALMSQRGSFAQGGLLIQNPDQLQQLKKIELKHLVQLIKAQFPEGLPEEYDDLTEESEIQFSHSGRSYHFIIFSIKYHLFILPFPLRIIIGINLFIIAVAMLIMVFLINVHLTGKPVTNDESGKARLHREQCSGSFFYRKRYTRYFNI